MRKRKKKRCGHRGMPWARGENAKKKNGWILKMENVIKTVAENGARFGRRKRKKKLT